MKSLFIIFSFIGSTSILAQNTQFHFQPNVINPASSGFFNKLSVSGMGYRLGFGPGFSSNSSLNYNQKLAVLKGGIGATLSYTGYDEFFKSTNLNINYSYHMVEREKFRLALGAGFSLRNERFQIASSSGFSNYNQTTPFLNLGTIAQFGNHTGQVSFRNINFGDAQGSLALNLIYNYDWTINDNFSLRIGANFYNQNGYNSFTLSTITQYKMVWVNLALTNRDAFITGVGIDIKDQFRIGAFLDNYYSKLYNDISSDFGLVLSYRIKNDKENKLTE